MSKQTVKLIILIVVIFVSSGLATYFIFNRPDSASTSSTSSPQVSSQPTSTPASTVVVPQPTPKSSNESRSFLSEMFGEDNSEQVPGKSEGWGTVIAKVTIRLLLASLFTALLAFRPRKFALLFQRNLFVAQTQILLAVVGSALMMIVGDSAARAFGIFAAVSLVRFRTNIRDPKEITVLLVSLAVGLATGVGRWELAAILCFFVLGLLWILEYRETEMVFRTMELSVKSRNLIETHEIIRDLFKKYDFVSELRGLHREGETDALGCIVFSVDVSPHVKTDELSAEILAADNDNIDSIEWSPQKNPSSLYQA